MPIRFSFVFVTMLVAGAATAAPRSIADCETIQAADAYNHCLASFGPAAGARGRSTGVDFSSERDVSRQARGAGGMVEHGRGGRVRMVLTPRHGAR